MLDICYFAALFLIYWLLVVVHELGHLWASILVGYSWREFKAGPVAVIRRGTEYHLIYSRGWLYGWVLCVRKQKLFFPWREAVLYAAGPLATLGGFLFMNLLLIVLPSAEHEAYWPLRVGATISVYFFVSSLVPIKIKSLNMKTDGLHLLELWLKKKPATVSYPSSTSEMGKKS